MLCEREFNLFMLSKFFFFVLIIVVKDLRLLVRFEFCNDLRG